MARQTSKGSSIRQKAKYVFSASTVTLVASLLGSANVVQGQGTTIWNPVKTTCNLRFGRGVVVGDKLYVDGGEQMDQQNYLDGIDVPYRNSNMFRWQNKHLWELDLSAKFNTSKPPWTAKEKPEDWEEHYNGAQGTLWNLGDGKFYTLGGWMSNIYQGPPGGHRIVEPYYTPTKAKDGTVTYHYQLPPTRIHVYNSKADNWTHIPLASDIHRLSDVGFTQSKRNKVGYTLGGFPVVEEQDGGSDKNFIAQNVDWVWQSTLSAYDFRTNKFNTTELPDDIGATNSVVLHSLDRVGDEGVLLALSGKSKNNNIEEYRPMDEMWIYDIASSQWMLQKATGSIPPVRTRSCSALVPAPDLSSYQLYMFSGATEGDVRILDMYVLSIPAFVWTKIDLVNYPNEWGIGDMACGLYEERQLIIVPGEVNVSTSANVNDTWFLECNMGTGVHVFDTYDWEFKAEFDPDAKGSKVPPAIVDLVGGDEKGNAKLHQPKAGWENKGLGSIFQIRNQLPVEDDSSSTSTATSKDTPPKETGSTGSDDQNSKDGDTMESKNNTGAIAGGVVGGILAIAFLIGLFLWWKRRQAAKQPSLAVAELGGNAYHGGGGYPMAPPYYDSPYNTPGGPYMPPQELQAYEPQEMGGAGFYAPPKVEHVQEHHQGAVNMNPPPSSVYPITPELAQQQLQVSPSFVSPVSPVQSPVPTVRTGLITRKAVGS